MSTNGNRENDLTALDKLFDEITVNAYGDNEILWAFRQTFEDDVNLPVDGFVSGEPVSVVEIDYDGNECRELIAKCRREDGSEHVVAASDVVFPEGSSGSLFLAAYSRWLGLEPYPAATQKNTRRKRQHKATEDDFDLRKPVELVVLSVKERSARCRLLGSKPRKQWRYNGHPYLSGEIESTELNVAAIDLVPLRLKEFGMWDPKGQYWGEEDEPMDEWAKPIIARGPRPEFEMEQVLPGADPTDPFSDPITESNFLKDAGDRLQAIRILMKLCQADLRCLDAHAHLGNFNFDSMPEKAIRHYEVGLRIGELSLGDDFDGVLHWGLIDNRPFLRCMHSYGLCLWRLGHFNDAECVFDRMLWLNPSDNQGVRFLIDDVKTRTEWKKREFK